MSLNFLHQQEQQNAITKFILSPQSFYDKFKINQYQEQSNIFNSLLTINKSEKNSTVYENEINLQKKMTDKKEITIVVNNLQSNFNEQNKTKKIISPFAPEATVPLPFQLKNYGKLGTTVWRRNERERYRVRYVNEGYERLRAHLPLSNYERRLSKVDTLRLAIYYIQHLQYLINDADHNLHCNCFAKFRAEHNIAEHSSASSNVD